MQPVAEHSGQRNSAGECVLVAFQGGHGIVRCMIDFAKEQVISVARLAKRLSRRAFLELRHVGSRLVLRR